MPREALSRRAVLDAALRLADAHGLAALSMRKLAAELGVEAMSLYNHVANKADLLDGVTARVFESIPLPDAALPWRQRLRELATGAHAALSAHPVVAGALAAGSANPRSVGSLRVIDAMLGALLDAGLDERDAARRYRSLFGLILGSVLVAAGAGPAGAGSDSAGPNGGPPRAEPIGEFFARHTRAGELPSLHRALPALLDIECTPVFAGELDFFLTGLHRTG